VLLTPAVVIVVVVLWWIRLLSNSTVDGLLLWARVPNDESVPNIVKGALDVP
jgi:hypothetical protein